MELCMRNFVRISWSCVRMLRNNYRLPIKAVSQFSCSRIQRNISSTSSCRADKNDGDDESQIPAAVASKYKLFKDETFTVMDIEEERRKSEESKDIEEDQISEYEGLNLERGATGVIEVEEVVNILRRENGKDIFVAAVPEEYKYVDYIVTVTGKSQRHMLAMAEFIRKVFKLKMYSTDIIPKIEGENSKDWIALDLGNIALHVFSRSARKRYDVDSLWAVGQEYDPLCNEPDDPVISMLKEHTFYLGDLTPVEDTEEIKKN